MPLSPICCFHFSSFHSSCPTYPPLLPCSKHIPVQGLCNMMLPLPHTLPLELCMVHSFPIFFCFLRVTFPNHPVFSHSFILDPLSGLFSLTVLVVCEKKKQLTNMWFFLLMPVNSTTVRTPTECPKIQFNSVTKVRLHRFRAQAHNTSFTSDASHMPWLSSLPT